VNRPFVHRGRLIAGVIQRCKATCPEDVCSQHKWAYSIELPAGPDGGRRQRTKGGFATGKQAMEARSDLAKLHRDGGPRQRRPQDPRRVARRVAAREGPAR
jgi:hypothetical protein